jgi:hypothetical protein
VTTVDIVHGGFLGAALFDAFTPGCVPGSFTNPCGSVFILGLTFRWAAAQWERLE